MPACPMREPARTRKSSPAPRRSRLLVVCHTHPRLSQGGAEIAAYEQFHRAREDDAIDAWFLASNGRAHGRKAGITIQQPFGADEFLHSGGTFDDFRLSNPDPAFEREFGELLRQLQPDIVHFHHYLGVGIEALLCVRHHAPQAKIVLTLHEYLLICHHFGQMVTKPALDLCYGASPQKCHRCFPEHSPQSFRMRELWLKRFLREVDEFVSPSDFLRERYIAWGLPAGKIRVQDNELPQHPPATPPHRLGGEPLRAAFFGQLSPLKGIDIFIRAARKIDLGDHPITFRIYGSSASQPKSFRDRVDKALEDLPSNVTFKGAYRNDDVVRLMAENHVIVVPSLWWENSPLVIAEARAAGCIILGSDLGGIAEKLRMTPSGRTFGYNDADDLANELIAIQRSDLPNVAPAPPKRR